jgi:uncharacterized integral membrane protein
VGPRGTIVAPIVLGAAFATNEGGEEYMITLVIVLIAVTVMVTFSVQNAAPVAVGFLAWEFQASLAVIILLSVLMGMVMGSIMVSLWRYKRSQRDKKTRTPVPVDTERQP